MSEKIDEIVFIIDIQYTAIIWCIFSSAICNPPNVWNFIKLYHIFTLIAINLEIELFLIEYYNIFLYFRFGSLLISFGVCDGWIGRLV